MAKRKLIERRYPSLRLMTLVEVFPATSFHKSDLTFFNELPSNLRRQLSPHKCVALISRRGDQIMFIFGDVLVEKKATGRLEPALTSQKVRTLTKAKFDWGMWQSYAEKVGIMLEGYKAFSQYLAAEEG